MPKYKVISSDSHVFEPADLWTSRIEPRFRARAPHVVRQGEYDQWYVDGDMKVGAIGLVSQAGTRFEAPQDITFEGSFENVRPGGYDPHEHIKDMETDGVEGEIIYPSMGLFLYKVRDSELLSAIFRTYNDWLAEFCSANPDRLKGIALVNDEDVQEGVKELERARKKGLVGGMISVYPSPDKQYDQPEYEPLWAAAQDLDMPISLHTATQRPGPEQPGAATTQTATFRANIDHWVRCSLSNIIYAGVFERYPKLKVAAVEFELAWAPVLSPHARLRLRRAAAAGDLQIQGRRYAQRRLPRQRLPQLPGRRPGYTAPASHRGGQSDVGLGLPSRGVHLAKVPGDPRQDTPGCPPGGEGEDLRGDRGQAVPLRLAGPVPKFPMSP